MCEFQDRGTPPNNATTLVRVTVRDNDDLSPRFTRDVYKIKIPEMSTYPSVSTTFLLLKNK